MDAPKSMNDHERELAELIVAALNLEIAADEVDPDAALYKEGLGLDSIDILEIALAVSKKYGFQLRSDDNDNIRIFSSLRNLSEHVQLHRTG
jgi:acyl carrier protein